MKLYWTLLVIIFGAASAAEGKTVDLAGQEASIDVPDTWTAQPAAADGAQSGAQLILAAVSAEKDSLLQIQVCANPKNLLATQSDLVANTKDAISNTVISKGGQVQFTGEGATQVNAVPAYLLQYTVTTPNAKQILGRLYQIAANGKLYIITLRTLDANADADLQGIANSFRFASPPVLPVPHPPGHRIRYILMGVAGILAVIGLGVGYYYHRQRQLYE